MNSCKPLIIYERNEGNEKKEKEGNEKNEGSKSIKTSPTRKKEEFIYSLDENIFDPTKSSPPNDFMLKLQLRMSHYNSFSNLDNLINE